MRGARLAPALALAAAGCGLFGPPAYVPIRIVDGVLVDSLLGRTLYTYDRDAVYSGTSACDAACAEQWQPLQAAEGVRASGRYGIIRRADGRRQWMYDGKPLYRSPLDTRAGERAGEAYANLWRIARP
jgi:predicted lipoprotein with Yx(FWY)xxD motif